MQITHTYIYDLGMYKFYRKQSSLESLRVYPSGFGTILLNILKEPFYQPKSSYLHSLSHARKLISSQNITPIHKLYLCIQRGL